ncbi:hypothetical protein Ddc_21770 [Ditylenchus destructor]|nr:hypothetical protein Ddc_21770 [Ditylenchus destructor]
MPITTSAAPTHAPDAGRSPVRSQSNGRMMTGVVAESVETMPNLAAGKGKKKQRQPNQARCCRSAPSAEKC